MRRGRRGRRGRGGTTYCCSVLLGGGRECGLVAWPPHASTILTQSSSLSTVVG